ncbi:MAG TPA: glycosyltransferase family 2 protein [Verrucomicrobiae bacterium]|nr:glycosyltransferase family 2 protein [Verrucomicrobiae bacterium]
MTDIEIPLGKRTRAYRFFEMLPALLSYGSVALLIILSLFNPLWAAIYLIMIVITLAVRAIAIAFRTTQGYQTLQRAQQVDWRARLDDLENPQQALGQYKDDTSWNAHIHKRNLESLAASPDWYPKPSELYNAVIIATYNESIDVLEPTVQSLLATDYDASRLILVLAYEERGGQAIQKTVEELFKKYSNKFYKCYLVKHPKDMPGEVIGKGGNITYAGKFLKEQLPKENIKYEQVIITTLDSDNRPHSTYFSYVTYEYIVNPNRLKLAFQPIALFLNNIWDVPAPMRVLAAGNSFWNIISSLRPHSLRNFAAHSQGMAALVEMDFWSVRTIVEDGHQYWRSYFYFDGDYSVVPIYVPIYQDAVLSDTYAKTLKAQFIQLRRWAYGASDVAYVATRIFHKNNKAPLLPSLARFMRLLDGHVTWASVPVIVAFGAWVPLFLNHEAARSIIAHELPVIVSRIQQFALIGLFVTVFWSLRMLPPRPARYKRRRTIFMVLQWLLMPITAICYSAATGFYSQTRLLFGKYLDKFDVTDKAVVSDKKSKNR